LRLKCLPLQGALCGGIVLCVPPVSGIRVKIARRGLGGQLTCDGAGGEGRTGRQLLVAAPSIIEFVSDRACLAATGCAADGL